jgi:hypothetical protein
MRFSSGEGIAVFSVIRGMLDAESLPLFRLEMFAFGSKVALFSRGDRDRSAEGGTSAAEERPVCLSHGPGILSRA